MYRILSSSLLLLLSLTLVPVASAKVTIKMATLAPVKSSWNRIFKKAAAEIKAQTGGEVIFRIYAGGSQGDEKKSVSKMRTNQLQAAAITAVGLGEIAPEILILQAPRLITSYRTLDRVRGKLKSRFENALAAKGFVLLGWGDVGLTYVYSTTPVATPSDLKKTKLWVWRDDPIVRAIARTIGTRGVPLSVPGVLGALNTNRVNAMIVSPLACLQLQWCNHMKYRSPHPVNVGIGAMVVRSKALAQLKPEHLAIVKAVWAKYSRALVRKVRRDNARAAVILREKKGIADTPVTPAAKAASA